MPGVIAGTRNVLNAAKKQSSMKSFVLTSSSTAACMPEFEKKDVVVDESMIHGFPSPFPRGIHATYLEPQPNHNTETWNEAAPMAAYSKHTKPDELPLMIYAASKTLGEQALWRWVEQEQPHFTVNAVLPNFNVRTPGTLESCGVAQDM